MGMCIRVHGLAIRHVATEFTPTQKVQNTRVSGKMINNMGKAMKPGLKELATKVNILKAKKKAVVSTLGQTAQSMRVNGSITK